MIQSRLEAYRRKKLVKKMSDSIKESVKIVFPWNSSTSREDEVEQTKPFIEKVELQETEDAESTSSEDSSGEHKTTVITKATYLLYFLLWAILYAIAIEFQFGAVYFILSMFIIIWFNTRSRSKKKGEPSAYSVFNPNCEAIQGTLDAAQLEREFGYRMH